MFFKPDVSFLQTEMEQIIEHLGAMPVFANEQFATLRVWSVHEFPLDVVKDGNHIRVVCRRTPYTHVSQLPVIDFSIDGDGKWKLICMKNSRFLDEYEYVNTLDFWERAIRFENYSEGFMEAVPA